LTFDFVKKLNTLNIVQEVPDAAGRADIGQKAFTIMPERSVSNIMAQGDGFNEIFIQMQKPADGPGDFRYQLNMQHTMGDMVVLDEVKHLCFIDISRIGPGMKNPVDIQGERLSVVRSQVFFRVASKSFPASDGCPGQTLCLEVIELFH
jgi:hypothetical protein